MGFRLRNSNGSFHSGGNIDPKIPLRLPPNLSKDVGLRNLHEGTIVWTDGKFYVFPITVA